MGMVSNWLIIAFRNLMRHKLYSTINVLGLAVGLAACLMIAVLVRFETSFDTYHENADRIVRINRLDQMAGREPRISSGTSLPVGPALASALPEVEAMARVATFGAIFRHEGSVLRQRVHRVDPEYFRLFDVRFLRGDAATALATPDSVVLTQETAHILFGTQDPMGRTLELTTGRVWRVTAVIADPPLNSSIRPRILVQLGASFSDSTDRDFREKQDRWTSHWVQTFLLRAPGVDAGRLEARMAEVLPRIAPDYLPPDKAGDRYTFSLKAQPLTDIHTNPQREAGTPMAVIGGLVSIGALVALVAGINFVNLTTARSSLRGREVAIRKTLGARRGGLVTQFLMESLLLAMAAGLLAVALLELLVPIVLPLVRMPVMPEPLADPVIFGICVGLPLLLGVLAGLYPALILAAFDPVRAMKGEGGQDRGRLRTMLVVLQFTIAITLGICAVVILSQTRYAATQGLGFERENVLLVRDVALDETKDKRRILVEEVRRLPGVLRAGYGAWAPGDGSSATSDFTVAGDVVELRVEPVDFGYLEALSPRLLAGRLFDPARAADIFQEDGAAGPRDRANILISAAALPLLGAQTAEQAIGRTLSRGSAIKGSLPAGLTIVGVIDDLRFTSARAALEPTILVIDQDQRDLLVLRFADGQARSVLAALGDTWRRLNPDVPLRWEFLDEQLAAQYAAEERQGVVIAVFAGLAMIIGCLGLYGLAAFAAQRRTREIGLRKVMGASVGQIVQLLVWQFSRPVFAANLIAWPLAWLLASHWLSGFAARISLGPLPFLLAGTVTILIAWLTVAGHAAQVAAARPSRALRHE